MFFCVENLGPIREAEVDLSKDLIVLTGPNNTGKTYLAWAVYALDKFQLRDTLPGVAELVDDLLARPQDEHSLAPVLEHPDFLRNFGEQCARSLAGEFGAPKEDFAKTLVKLQQDVHRLRDSSHGVRMSSFSPRLQGTFLPILNFSYQKVFLEAFLMEEGTLLRGSETTQLSWTDDADNLRRWITRGLLGHIHGLIRESRRSEIFPVERLAINTFSKELASQRTMLTDELRSLVEQGDGAQVMDEVTRRVDRYPTAIKDALYAATRLESTAGKESTLADLADELESTILGGRVSVSEHNVLEFSPAGASGAKLRIQQTASVVKSLASLVFYLRHRAEEDDRLIIDEPELNLHPDNQRKVARILAKLVQRGIKLIISTHSDYLIRELNNLIMLSQDSEEARRVADELSIEPEMTLRPEQLGVYLFGRDGLCEQLEVSETGFEVETIDREIHRLNQDAQMIYSRLFLDGE